MTTSEIKEGHIYEGKWRSGKIRRKVISIYRGVMLKYQTAPSRSSLMSMGDFAKWAEKEITK